MLTKKQQEFLIEIYENNGEIITKDQKSFICLNYFYRTITKLTKLKLVDSYQIDIGDKRINVYNLTMRGLHLVKIINGEDYEI